MAEQLQVGTTTVKIRNPVVVFVWALVTVGIYYVVWYYKVNREMRDAAGIDVSPWVCVLAITFGGLIVVPPFVSWWNTFERIRQTQERAGLDRQVSPALGIILYIVAFFFLPIELIYAQDELNKVWRARMASTV
jgi:hypothetical protein